MKKFSFAILLASILVFTACGNNNDAPPNTTASTEVNDDTNNTDNQNTNQNVELVEGSYKIGISQFIQHEALDKSKEGFIQALADNGFREGENLVLDIKNANGDNSVTSTISQKFIADKVDLLLGIATPSAVSLARETSEIPILVTAVTDLESENLVVSNESPGRNVTGTSDLNPVKEQIDLLLQFVPELKKIAVLYSAGESNSHFQAELVKNYVESLNLGIEVEYATVSSPSDISQVTQSLAGKVDAIYIPTDNDIANGMSAVASVAINEKIPVIVGEEGMTRSGGMASVSISYFELGYRTGEMAVEILKGNATPADIPVEISPTLQTFVNKKVCDSIGMAIPKDLPEDTIIIE